MEHSWLYALTFGFVLDLCLGDPHWAPHPVRWIGRLCTWLEGVLRGYFPKTQEGERMAGILLVTGVLLTTISASLLLLWVCGLLSPLLRFFAEVILSYQMLAARSLYDESMEVYDALDLPDLEEARERLSMIVGRDTAHLDESGIAKAAVETVAENTSDGVIAPLFYLALGGPVWGLAYKAINTMDSMVGYHNEKYENFGWFAARVDDVANFIPSRVAAILMILAAAFQRRSPIQAAKIWWRDRRKHKSPNSAQTEAVCAGALGIELGGDTVYAGKVHHKPTLGDPLWPVEAEDIVRANWLMLLTAWLGLIFLGGGAALLFYLIG